MPRTPTPRFPNCNMDQFIGGGSASNIQEPDPFGELLLPRRSGKENEIGRQSIKPGFESAQQVISWPCKNFFQLFLIMFMQGGASFAIWQAGKLHRHSSCTKFLPQRGLRRFERAFLSRATIATNTRPHRREHRGETWRYPHSLS